MRKYTFTEHLDELKTRLLKLLVIFCCLFALCYYFSDELYRLIFAPLAAISEGVERKVIYTGLAEAFLAYIKLSAFFAFIFFCPMLCYQIYTFIRPGLHAHERMVLSRVILLSLVLFYAGCTFMLLVVMPKAWVFFTSYEKSNIGLPLVLEARISEYLSLVVQFTMAFAICFQLPVVLVILVLMGLITTKQLREKRRLAVVMIFIVAAIFTPPDVLSQIALAIPLLLLYEISIILCKSLEKKLLEKKTSS